MFVRKHEKLNKIFLGNMENSEKMLFKRQKIGYSFFFTSLFKNSQNGYCITFALTFSTDPSLCLFVRVDGYNASQGGCKVYTVWLCYIIAFLLDLRKKCH